MGPSGLGPLFPRGIHQGHEGFPKGPFRKAVSLGHSEAEFFPGPPGIKRPLGKIWTQNEAHLGTGNLWGQGETNPGWLGPSLGNRRRTSVWPWLARARDILGWLWDPDGAREFLSIPGPRVGPERVSLGALSPGVSPEETPGEKANHLGGWKTRLGVPGLWGYTEKRPSEMPVSLWNPFRGAPRGLQGLPPEPKGVPLGPGPSFRGPLWAPGIWAGKTGDFGTGGDLQRRGLRKLFPERGLSGNFPPRKEKETEIWHTGWATPGFLGHMRPKIRVCPGFPKRPNLKVPFFFPEKGLSLSTGAWGAICAPKPSAPGSF